MGERGVRASARVYVPDVAWNAVVIVVPDAPSSTAE